MRKEKGKGVEIIMLTPCNPCICTGASCEQCMFGYQSAQTNEANNRVCR